MKKYLFTILILLCLVGQGWSTGELGVSATTRIMHPAYRSGQYTYSVRNPFNLDNTKVVMYEEWTMPGDIPENAGRWTKPANGRKHVVGTIATLKSISKTATADWDDWFTDYNSSITPVPSPGSINRGDTAIWSVHAGEGNILFVLYQSGSDAILRKFDVTNMASTSNAIATKTLTGGSSGMIMGWTKNDATPRLLVLNNQDSSVGWYVTTGSGATMTTTAYNGETDCTAAKRNLPTTGHGHGGRSPAGNYAINFWANGDYRTDAWGGYKRDEFYTVTPQNSPCTRYDIRSYSNFNSTGREFNYSNWSVSEDWFIGLDLGNGPYNSTNFTDEWGIWQAMFVAGQQSPALTRYKLLETTSSGWTNNAYGGLNWSGHPFPFLSSDSTLLWYTSTGGKCSYEDRVAGGACTTSNWGYEGIFLADVEARTECNDLDDNDSDGLIDMADTGCSSTSDTDEGNAITPPNLTVLDSPRAVKKTNTFSLNYNLAVEVGGSPTVSFYYDQTGSGCTGTLIGSCTNLGVGTGVSCDVDTTAYSVGLYYFCGTTSGGDGTQETLYWPSVQIYES